MVQVYWIFYQRYRDNRCAIDRQFCKDYTVQGWAYEQEVVIYLQLLQSLCKHDFLDHLDKQASHPY